MYLRLSGETLTSYIEREIHSKNKAVDNPIKTCGITSLGPVLTSLHSTAVSLILSRGSSQETPKYMEMDMVCNVRKLFLLHFPNQLWPSSPLLEGKMAEKKMQHSNFPTLHKKNLLLYPHLQSVFPITTQSLKITKKRVINNHNICPLIYIWFFFENSKIKEL